MSGHFAFCILHFACHYPFKFVFAVFNLASTPLISSCLNLSFMSSAVFLAASSICLPFSVMALVYSRKYSFFFAHFFVRFLPYILIDTLNMCSLTALFI